MTSSRPYLIRALYEWIVDNQHTPYMLVDASDEQVLVPRAFVENKRIILNISPDATHSLVLGNDAISFNARFSGAAMDVHVPVTCVVAVYAKENGQGMIFEEQPETPRGPDDPPPNRPVLTDSKGDGKHGGKPATAPATVRRPSLKIVK